MRFLKLIVLLLSIYFSEYCLAQAQKFQLAEIGRFKPQFDFVPHFSGEYHNTTHLSEAVLTADKTKVFICASYDARTKCYLLNSDGSVVWTYPSDKSFLTINYPSIVALKDRFVLMSSSGEVAVLSVRGELLEKYQLAVPKGTGTRPDFKPDNGRFLGEPTLMPDGKTLVVPSETGEMLFFEGKKTVKTVPIDCDDACYFYSPVLVRSDGVLGILESGFLILFSENGKVIYTEQKAFFQMTLSEDRKAFVSVYWGRPRAKDSKDSRILVLQEDGTSHRIALENLHLSHATRTSEGIIHFVAQKYESSSWPTNYLGILKPDEGLSQVIEIKSRGSLYSFPLVDDQGNIFVQSLDGEFFALNSDGILQSTIRGGGEYRHAPLVMKDGTIVAAVWGMLYEGTTMVRFFQLKQSEGEQR